jgi:TonB-like protein
MPKSPIVIAAPPEAARLGLAGEVFVAVSVDANGSASNVVVSAWSDPMFIEPALIATKRAQYRPAYSECRPMSSTYTATLKITVPPKRERVDVIGFFPGSWRCGAAQENWSRTFRGVVRDAAQVHEEFIRDPDGSWILKRGGLRVARARPWIDERWVFALGESPPQPGVVEYNVIRPDLFERLTASPGEAKTEYCVRHSAD